MKQTGRNESEPHQMSLETPEPGAKPNPSLLGEGRREQAGQQSAPAQTSGRGCVDSTSGSKTRVSWEDSGDGKQKSPESAQAGRASKADSIAGEVGVPHSTVDLQQTVQRGKGGYLLNAERRSEGRWDAWADSDNNPGES